MKKFILLVVLVALFQGTFLFAQVHKESEYYYYNFPIEKIYAYRLGYMVVYRRAENRLSRTYIPQEWFGGISGKGEVLGLGSGKEWPSMTVYYRIGEFSHVRLKLRRERTHETWDLFPLNVNIDEYFQNIDEVKIEH
ncbi:MAG: hypothetical protein LBH42_02120 [Treponema sp.]|jgi:hypothetical protein|nr:hypothetical protein [Treponema sp.]